MLLLDVISAPKRGFSLFGTTFLVGLLIGATQGISDKFEGLYDLDYDRDYVALARIKESNK